MPRPIRGWAPLARASDDDRADQRGYCPPQDAPRDLPSDPRMRQHLEPGDRSTRGSEEGRARGAGRAIREHRDLAERLDLIESVERRRAARPRSPSWCACPRSAAITREKVAALAGLAPYDDDSGEHIGDRHIEGGRERLRRALYSAALPASFRWNAQLIALYKRLIAARKGAQAALVACARKLLIFVNTVVARGIAVEDNRLKATRSSRLLSPFLCSTAADRFFVPTCPSATPRAGDRQGWPSLPASPQARPRQATP